MFKVITTTLLIVLLAGTVMAGKVVDTPQFDLTLVGANDSPTGRALYILSYDFSAAPVAYHNSTYGEITFGNEGILPAGATMIAFGYTDFVADIYDNMAYGASFSNWASECWVGVTFEDPIDGLSYVGVAPFADTYDGPGTFGPTTAHFDFAPTDWPVPTADDFTFYLNATWNDGTGMSAGMVTGGTVYAWIDSDIIPNETMTLGSVKALFR